MKAAILRDLGKPLSIENLEVPKLGRGQVLVKMQLAAVCHSQKLEVSGGRGADRFLPHLIGHEGVGIVIDVGPGVAKVKKNMQVVLSWIRGSGEACGPVIYQSPRGPVNAGPIATFCETPVVSQQCVTPIEPPVQAECAVLAGCALPTGAGTVWNAMKPNPQSSVCILGAGGVGLSAISGAAYAGWSLIAAVDLHSLRLQRAKELGATHTVQARNGVEKALADIMEGKGFDLVVECAGSPEAMEMAVRIAKPKGGKVMIAGNLETGKKISINPFDLIQGRTLSGSWGGWITPETDIPKFTRLLEQGKMNYKLLTGKTFSLGQINEAVAELSREDPGRPLIQF
jgi:S-(hydroxymethyl)glutathione dehydrogenase/alcohol dehydrogenase